MMKIFQSVMKNCKDKRKDLAARMRLMFYRDRNETIRYASRTEAKTC